MSSMSPSCIGILLYGFWIGQDFLRSKKFVKSDFMYGFAVVISLTMLMKKISLIRHTSSYICTELYTKLYINLIQHGNLLSWAI